MNVPIEWLTHRVEDAPTSYLQGRSPTAALRLRAAWQRLKSQAAGADELWAFSSPPHAWKRRGGYAGYALVRDGQILQSTVVAED